MPPGPRMSSSAMSSSRCVVTPAATSACSASWVRCSTAPDAAIASISPGVFGMGPRGRWAAVATWLALAFRRRDVRDDLIMDLVRCPLPVDLAQEATGAVVVDERSGLLIVDGQPVLDRLRPV